MKCKKRYLGLIVLTCITSSVFVGCNKKDSLSNNDTEVVEVVDNNDSNNQETTEVTAEGATEEPIETNKLTKEEALNLVKKEVLEVFPNAKLKIKDDKYSNGYDFYTIEYDAPYCTTAEFLVDSTTGEVRACDEGSSTSIDMATWKEEVEVYFDTNEYKATTAEEAKNIFVSRYNSNETHERGGWTKLSQNQLDNFEVVTDELVEYEKGYCGWVFRYPMEEEHSVYENSYDDNCTRSNAKSIDDKYAYIFFQPLKLNSEDKSSFYYAHICDGDGTYFYWE